MVKALYMGVRVAFCGQRSDETNVIFFRMLNL